MPVKLHTFMPPALRPFYTNELESYAGACAKGALQDAWHHLERAHVIGQAYPAAHTYVHWKMLQFGFRIKSPREILGQLPRLLAGGVKSFVGTIPVGNTGGAGVPPLRPMPVAPDILAMFRAAGLKS